MIGGDLDTVTNISASLPVADIVDRLNADPPTVPQGYPSALALLAEEQRAGRLRISPTVVRGNSEQLPDEVRERISSAFRVEVGSGYGTSEGVHGAAAPGTR